MPLNPPDFLLCEDPTAEKENLYIYHTPTRSLVHIMHSDAIPDSTEMRHLQNQHFDYSYTSNAGEVQKIMFFAEMADGKTTEEQYVLKLCAHWYACYLGWEDDCDEINQQTQSIPS